MFHVLFSVDPKRDEISEEGVNADIIRKDAVIASINFMKTACQHALYIAGKAILEEEVHATRTGMYIC